MVVTGSTTQGREHIIKQLARGLAPDLNEPFPPEHAAEQKPRQPQKNRQRADAGVGCGLGGVRGHGRPLLSRIFPDVDAVGQQRTLAISSNEPFGPPICGHQAKAVQQPKGAQQRRPINGRRQYDARARDLGRAQADPVNLNVIGMSVAASGVVNRYGVGMFGAQQVGKPLRRRLDVRPCECVRITTSQTVHARIVIAQQMNALDSQSTGRVVQFVESPVGQRARCNGRSSREAFPASGRNDKHDAMAFGGGSGKRAAGQQRFVVGMRVHGYEGVAHCGIVSHREAR